MGSIVRSLFDNVVRRRATPFVLLFEPSQRCDCRCAFCYHWEEHREGEMSLPLIRKVLDEAAALGCGYLFLGGGEPLISPTLLETLSQAQQRGYRTVVTTNGSRLAQRAEDIAPFVERIAVSIDFPDERHDELRGRRGLFEAATRGIQIANRLGIDARITMSVYRDNVSELPAMARLAQELGVRLHARLMTRESVEMKDVPVLEGQEERAEVARTLTALRMAGYPVATPRRYLETIATDRPFRCRVGRLVMNIDAQGRVYVPCPRHEGTKDLLFGVVTETNSLEEIWFGEQAERFREETLGCKPGVDCYSACVHDVSRVIEPDIRFWWDELIDGASLSRFYVDGLAKLRPRGDK